MREKKKGELIDCVAGVKESLSFFFFQAIPCFLLDVDGDLFRQLNH